MIGLEQGLRDGSEVVLREGYEVSLPAGQEVVLKYWLSIANDKKLDRLQRVGALLVLLGLGIDIKIEVA